MSVAFDTETVKSGTRFAVLPPLPTAAPSRSEVIYVAVAPETLRNGLADNVFCVVDACDKLPYNGKSLPPFTGQRSAPPRADANGHYDHIEAGQPGYLACHLYATARRAYDVWRSFSGRDVAWHFNLHYPRLELIPYIESPTTQLGYGYLECGRDLATDDAGGPARSHCLNSHLVVQAIGHALLRSHLTDNGEADDSPAQRTFESSNVRLFAALVALHSPTVAADLLQRARGNLATLRPTTQGLQLIEGGFTPSRLCDAMFDILLRVYEANLIEAEFIGADFVAAARREESFLGDVSVRGQFTEAYIADPCVPLRCLTEARDYFGALLISLWSGLAPGDTQPARIGRKLLSIDRALTGGRCEARIRDAFAAEGIHYAATSPQRTPTILAAQ
jgi:hypothetical protein